MTLVDLNNSGTPPRATLGRLELRYPPLPQTLMEAMDLMEHPEKLEVGPVTEMVQRDPIVIARLLQIVNSSYYGLHHSIGSAERAVIMLGPVAVTGIVVGMNMLKLNAALQGDASDCFFKLIRHSVATAFLTRHLIEGPPRVDMGAAPRAHSRLGVSFTAGMLHDFGKIILVYNRPEEAVGFYAEGALERQIDLGDERELEQLLFGYDHTEAGEFVARKLNFPDLLIDIIRLHHDSEALQGRQDTHRLLRAVTAANLAAKAMGYAFSTEMTWEEIAENPVWSLILERERGRRDGIIGIMSEIYGLQEHLDTYVNSMISGPESATPPKQDASPPAEAAG